MMTPLAKLVFVSLFVVVTIVGAIVAIVTDTQTAAAQSRYLAPAFNTSIVKHADVAQNERLDIPFGSDDAAYRAAAEPVKAPALFGSFFAPVSLPTTAAPVEQGNITCQLQTTFNRVFSVQLSIVDCAANGGTVK